MFSWLIVVVITLIVIAILWAFEIISFNANRSTKTKAFWLRDHLFELETGKEIASVYQSAKPHKLWYFERAVGQQNGGYYVSKVYAMIAAESFFQVEIVSEPRGRNGEVKDND